MSLSRNLSVDASPPPKKVKFNIIIPKATSLSEITLNIKDEEEPTASTIKEDQRPEVQELSDNDNWDNVEPEVLLTTLFEGESSERKFLENEKFCLISEVNYPFAKGSKTLCIGVRPTESFKPVVRISNPQLTTGILFEMDEFKEFCAKLNPVVSKADDEKDEVTFFLTNYHVVKEENKDFLFKPKQKAKGLKPLMLSKDAIVDILKKENMILNTLVGLTYKTKGDPEEYNKFVQNLALHVKEHGFDDFNNTALNIIKQKHRSNPVLYEILTKLPYTLRNDVENQMGFRKL